MRKFTAIVAIACLLATSVGTAANVAPTTPPPDIPICLTVTPAEINFEIIAITPAYHVGDCVVIEKANQKFYLDFDCKVAPATVAPVFAKQETFNYCLKPPSIRRSKHNYFCKYAINDSSHTGSCSSHKLRQIRT